MQVFFTAAQYGGQKNEKNREIPCNRATNPVYCTCIVILGRIGKTEIGGFVVRPGFRAESVHKDPPAAG